MGEYTYDNVIIDPHKEGVRSLIGKEVYFGDTPMECLHNANIDNRASLGILTEIREKFNFPFRIDRTINLNHLDNGDFVYEDWNFLCFIPKKEDPKPEFVPFKSADEFIDEYDNANYSINSETLENKLLSYGGVWLKSKKDYSLCMVARVSNDGLVICDKERTTSEPIEYNVKMSWAEILADFLFLDGTPCGMNSLRRSDDE